MPHPGEEWVGALVPLPSYVTNEGEPYRPVAVMWVDAESYFIHDTEVVHPDEALERAAGLFLSATRHPKNGPPHTPARLRVSDANLAAALRGAIGDVELVIAPTPEITAIVDDMTAHLTKRAEPPSFLGPDTTAGDVATMFAAAARLYRAAPWTALPPDVYIGVSCDLLGIVDGTIAVVGQRGQSYGFSLFGSMEKTLAFYAAVEANQRGERPAIPAHIMFSYDPREDLPDELVREVAHHGWEVAGRAAYPSPKAIDEDRVVRELTRVELHGISSIMTALADLVDSEPRLAEAWERDDDALTWNRKIETPLGTVEVELRAPVELPGADGELTEEELDEYAEALLDDLSRLPGIDEMHLRCADTLIMQAGYLFGEPFLQLLPEELHQLLFEHIPRNVAVGPEVAPFTIAAARHLMTLGAEQHAIANAKECLAALAAPEELVTRLARALADAKRYSPTKVMIMQAIRDGYDMTNELDVAVWVETQRRRNVAAKKKAAKSKSMPKPKSKPKPKASPRKKKPRSKK